MEDSNSQTNGGPSAENTAREKRPIDALLSALRQGAEDARKAAEQAVPRIKAAVAEADYWAAYGLAFAAVFPWTVAKNITPDTVKAGCRDGTKAGKEAAEQWMDNLKREKSSERPIPPLIVSTGPAGTPGMP